MRIACRIPKATKTHSEYVIIITFRLPQWLHERASLVRYTYIVCIVALCHQDVEVNFVPHREYSASILKTGLLILCMDITVTVSNSTGSVRILHC